MGRNRAILGLIVAWVLCAASVQALADKDQTAALDPRRPATSTRAAVDSSTPRLVAAARRVGRIKIDGRIDESAWLSAPKRTNFWQRNPNEAAPPKFKTEFRVLFDADSLYVAVRAHDPEPKLIRGLLTRRDVGSSSDWIMIGVDSYYDRRTAFVFAINPAGVQRDFIIFDNSTEDDKWNAVWQCATRVDSKGWVAEYKIPYSQLRFSGAPTQTWGLQVMRTVARTQEENVWSPWPRASSQVVSQFGTLSGIAGIKPARRIELLPYVTAGSAFAQVDNLDPFANSIDKKAGVGLDFKYGLTSNMTLAGTINPDFGQVEADPSQVNLSDNEAFFAERRPFFLEGANIFGFGLGQGDGDNSVEKLFYSRRIGATPHDSASGLGDYYSEPDLTTIYGAAKLSGKTAGGWSVGLLNAVTARETATVAHPFGGVEVVDIEPLTNYSVLRLSKDFNAGRTKLGGAFTNVHRDNSERLDWLHDRAYAGGLGVEHRFGKDRFHASLKVAGSYVHGTAAAIDNTQRASQHYYQRPDAEHVNYDPSRTSLTGAAMLWSLTKIQGGQWRGGAGGDSRSPGFEVNDLGFQRSADYYTQWLWLQYRQDKPGKLLRNYSFNSNVWTVLDWSPRATTVGGNLNVNGQLLNFWGGHMGVSVDGNRWNNRKLRGGPSVRNDLSYSAWANAWTDPRNNVTGSVGANVWRQPATGSYSVSVNPSLSIQARSNLVLSFGPSVSKRVDDNQYVEEVADSTGTPHYVLARINQLTAGLTVRVNYTFSPRLSLQFYAQPFLASGDYSRFKEASDPTARNYRARYSEFGVGELRADLDSYVVDRQGDGVADYVFGKPDFSFGQLRSNLVFRWEYRPGSTLFVVWSHDRTRDDSMGQFRFADDLRDLARETGEHVVLVKLNYWLGM